MMLGRILGIIWKKEWLHCNLHPCDEENCKIDFVFHFVVIVYLVRYIDQHSTVNVVFLEPRRYAFQISAQLSPPVTLQWSNFLLFFFSTEDDAHP